MVFIGNGALLIRALRHCVHQKIPIGGVVSEDPLPDRLKSTLGCECRLAIDCNLEKEFIASRARSGVVWSINNKTILRGDLLSLSGLRFYNIHGGLVERYRGLSEICVFFATLRGEVTYGATLHEIDGGIDTGPIVKQLSFDMTAEDTFHSVMHRTLAACQTLFETTCLSEQSIRAFPTRRFQHTNTSPFTYRRLSEALAFRAQETWRRATYLGSYAGYFPRLQSWIREAAQSF
jgi:methionyl-tRNA formyltransferase